jgi:hypothetical protein
MRSKKMIVEPGCSGWREMDFMETWELLRYMADFWEALESVVGEGAFQFMMDLILLMKGFSFSGLSYSSLRLTLVGRNFMKVISLN